MVFRNWDPGNCLDSRDDGSKGLDLHRKRRRGLGSDEGSALDQVMGIKIERISIKGSTGHMDWIQPFTGSSLLIGNSGDQKAGEGTRKRLKISILHFDNPALIKRYAKTLIGRCMNPEEQNMKALLVNLPKIWSLEDGAVGHRFGEEKCPLGMLSSNKSPEQNRDTRDGIGGNFDGGKHDDRARSYSGVLVNGNMSYQNKERDSRDYYGKGKGKMFEEPESKWVKVAERGNKRSYNRGNYRGASENSHYKQGRREDLRVESQEGRARSSSEQIRAPQELKDTREELPKLSLSPSKEFKEEPAKTQTTGTEVILDSAEEEMGLQKVKDLVENQGALSDEDVMEMDEIRAAFLEHGIDMDNPQDLSEEEPVGEAILQEEGDDIAEEKEDCISVEEKEMVLGEPVKKQGLRKRQFKPTISTAGSNKTRISNALVSPRKRGVAKTWSRYGENSKTLEGKVVIFGSVGTALLISLREQRYIME
ncbi:hypothetical protein Bca4012_092737 [Brassica carinata]